MLLVGRAIAGITSANMAVATAYVTDITPEEKRAERFGYIHAMFGIGFLIGPLLGGVLGEFWVRAPFLAAAFFNLANFLIAYFVLPESRKGEKIPISLQTLNPFRLLKWSLTIRALIPFLIIFFILNFVGQIYGTVWVLYGEDNFNWSPFVIGMSLAAYGLFHALVQGILPGPAARMFGERKAFLFGASAEILALVLIAFASHGWMVFALLPLFSLGGIGMPALQSLATREVNEDNQGRLQGVLTSLMSVSAIIGPLFFAGAYFAAKSSWPGVIWLIGAGCYLLVIPFVLSLKIEAKPVK
jgi:DHA1 family tetracycline resistance protein-like MFS transporter